MKGMMKMKKVLTVLIAGMLVFSLVACGGSNVNSPDDEYDITDNDSEDTVKEINMVYGDDETPVTLHKPENASFTLGSDTPEDAGDLVGLCADDYSWDAEIMGYKNYGDIGSNEPFVEYYFLGEVVTEDYESYNEEVTDLGINYEGNPVKVIRYTYKTTDDDETYSECFVGFEYKGSDDNGLMGIKIGSFEEDLSDNELKKLFSELFYLEK